MKTKKKKIVRPTKAVVTSPYPLSADELEKLRSEFPIMGSYEAENKVDNSLHAGLIITVGAKRIDLSLERGLQNLKQFIYENS